VSLRGLTPDQTVYYRVAGDARVFSFQMPRDAPAPAKSAFTVGLTADLGQTAVSNASITALIAMQPDVVLCSGDLSYAYGWYSRWDSFGMLMERLTTKIPMMTCPGNHEIKDGEQFVSYNHRYPMPAQPSGSSDNTYWARQVEAMQLISLNTYASSAPGSMQYNWLKQVIGSIDRQRTPWVVVMMHAPWYNSNHGHREEALLMQRSMEPLLYEAGVDLVLNGHVHAYERTFPVYNGQRDPCGPVHLNLGDGGNREGGYVPWLDPQPAWSAFRESSFGVGRLRVHNNTHAEYSWARHACWDKGAPGAMNFSEGCRSSGDNSAQFMATTDSVWITRPAACPNRHFTGSEPGPTEPDAPDRSSKDLWEVVALVMAVLLMLALGGLAVKIAEVNALTKVAAAHHSADHDEERAPVNRGDEFIELKTQ